MKRIAKFHKVSPEQFAKDWKDTFPAADDKEIQDTYEKISLPVRATAGSAGYDFFAPADIVLNPGETAKIPTGVRVEMEQDWVLKCYPRSGLGFKFRLQLNNTVGIIDSDYFYSDNEGHIFAKITNDSNEGKTVNIQAGTGFMQGIFVEYGITVDDEATGIRNGGFGSLCSFCIFIITFDVGKNWISCFCTGEFIKIYLSTLILAIFVQRQQRNVFLLFYWKYGQNCTFDLSVIVQRQCNGVVTFRRSVSAVQSAGSTVAGCTGSVFEFITHLIILTLYSLSFHFNR